MKVTNGLLNSVPPTIVSNSSGIKHRSSTTTSAKSPIHQQTKTSTNHHVAHHPVTDNIVSSNLASNLNEDDFIGSASEFIKGKIILVTKIDFFVVGEKL